MVGGLSVVGWWGAECSGVEGGLSVVGWWEG